MATLTAVDKGTLQTGWDVRHNEALKAPKPGSELAILGMLNSWRYYAQQHQARFESPVGPDGVLGAAWVEIGEGLLKLLNGDLGRFDGAVLDSFIRDTVAENGGVIE